MKKMRYQPILIALILLLLCGAAVAAVSSWSVRDALTRHTRDGEPVVNEVLMEYTQPIGQVYENGMLRVEVTDALYDGASVVAAWTVTNLSDELLYLHMGQTEDSIDWNSGPASFSGADEFIEPGKTVNCMMDCRVYDLPGGNMARVGIRYQIVRATGEIAYIDYPEMGYMKDGNYIHYEDGGDRLEAYREAARAALDEGKVPITVWDGGYLSVSDGFYSEVLTAAYEALDATGERYTMADAMAQTGLFAIAGTLDVAFDLQVPQGALRSLLPEGALPERAYDDFTMRISKADCSPGTLEIIVDAIYPDEETAKAYEGVSFVAFDENGRMDWDDNSGWGAHIQGPVGQPDGTWLMQWEISHSQMVYLPEEILVCPRITQLRMKPTEEINGAWDIKALPGQEEGIVLYTK